MLKARGVSLECAKFEEEHNLYYIGLDSLETAQGLADAYCKHFNLPNIVIYSSCGKKLRGRYRPSVWKTLPSSIYLSKHTGMNAAVEIHELAHHYQHEFLNSAHHDNNFKAAHLLFLKSKLTAKIVEIYQRKLK